MWRGHGQPPTPWQWNLSCEADWSLLLKHLMKLASRQDIQFPNFCWNIPWSTCCYIGIVRRKSIFSVKKRGPYFLKGLLLKILCLKGEFLARKKFWNIYVYILKIFAIQKKIGCFIIFSESGHSGTTITKKHSRLHTMTSLYFCTSSLVGISWSCWCN